jgi:isocitrate dehydrogenase (NAD+)
MSKQRITVIPGDGIGPSIIRAAVKVLDKLDCGFEYDFAEAGLAALKKNNELIPKETMSSINTNKVVLKGPLTTPVGQGFTSVNVTLRQTFDLYANVRPVRTFEGVKSRYENIDIIIIRENTEGLYSGQGQTIDKEDGHAEAKSIITKKGSERVIRFAYEFALREGRKKITTVHKANILKTTSGLFLNTAREIAKEYSDIESNDLIVDNCCMQLVMHPEKFDMIVTTNLFGDILSDLCAGFVGGLGMAPGANIGDSVAIFEAVHGSAPDIAGKNIANPSSVLLACELMLKHLNFPSKAEQLRFALKDVIAKGDRLTPDLGGKASTTEFTDAILERL